MQEAAEQQRQEEREEAEEAIASAQRAASQAYAQLPPGAAATAATPQPSEAGPLPSYTPPVLSTCLSPNRPSETPQSEKSAAPAQGNHAKCSNRQSADSTAAQAALPGRPATPPVPDHNHAGNTSAAQHDTGAQPSARPSLRWSQQLERPCTTSSDAAECLAEAARRSEQSLAAALGTPVDTTSRPGTGASAGDAKVSELRSQLRLASSNHALEMRANWSRIEELESAQAEVRSENEALVHDRAALRRQLAAQAAPGASVEQEKAALEEQIAAQAARLAAVVSEVRYSCWLEQMCACAFVRFCRSSC